jgi:hypothetical protein
MKTPFVVLLLSASVFSSVGIVAQAAPFDSTSIAAPAATTLRMRGTIDNYDAATRMLSLKTADGVLQFPLASMVRIRQGADNIEAEALEKLVGHRAAVRYSESSGQKTAESIHVFGKNERTRR